MLSIKGTPAMIVMASPNRIGPTQKPDMRPDAIALSPINAVVFANGSTAK
jgi:hypothetical protein